MAESSYEVVERFCEAWKHHDLDAIMAFFTDDAEYQNVPMGPGAKGKAAIKGVIDSFWPMAKSIEFKVLRAAANGNTVINERVDIFDLGAKKIELPVAGVFEVRGSKIALWRDYFDLATWTKQMS
ncbi:MAG TPA: limonene-1,2-epoxide hydrolase family protein [Candidatus Binataceae bacterium]|nr:limonene-1,2-epoxide hydrolase family protein [Candidatus Binataceae bacterium]